MTKIRIFIFVKLTNFRRANYRSVIEWNLSIRFFRKKTCVITSPMNFCAAAINGKLNVCKIIRYILDRVEKKKKKKKKGFYFYCTLRQIVWLSSFFIVFFSKKSLTREARRVGWLAPGHVYVILFQFTDSRSLLAPRSWITKTCEISQTLPRLISFSMRRRRSANRTCVNASISSHATTLNDSYELWQLKLIRY